MQNHSAPIKAVFFDLGHTLIYFADDFEQVSYESYGIMADSLIQSGCQIDRKTYADLFCQHIKNYYAQRDIDFIERPVEELVKRTLSELGKDHMQENIYTEAVHEMYKVTERHWLLEEDTLPMLHQLLNAGYRLALISNAASAWDLDTLIDNHHLRSYFWPILISANEGLRKPDRRIFLHATQLLDIQPAEAVMVGDLLDADILGAHQVGMRGVWISRRVAPATSAQLANPQKRPDAEIHTLAELPDVLAQWNQ